MECELCKKPINVKFGSGRFCGSLCARSFSTKAKRSQINTSVSAKLMGHPSTSTKLIGRKRSEAAKTAIRNGHKRRTDRLPFEKKPGRLRRQIVLQEQNNRCAHCNLDASNWNGKVLVLQIEHIDGNNKNNLRSNLEALCPNCHSQTSTWGFKKR